MTLVVETRTQLAAQLAARRRGGERVGFVPTMGALHDGHASLMRVARKRVGDGPVVVSIFVNPLQFAPTEDLDRYPRTLEDDVAMCEAEGVDIVFVPAADEVYPGGVAAGATTESITVDPGPLADAYEGASRPGHFRGVLTVVTKLFGLVRPDVAVFGEKDYQQLVLIQKLASELCLGVEIVGAETQREADGLARSSRNRYLDSEDRLRAAALNRVLRAAQDAAHEGLDAALDAARAELRTAPGVDLDYLTITDLELGELPADPAEIPPGTRARIMIAARVGTTRLIDNLPLTIGGSSTKETPAHPDRAVSTSGVS